MTTHDPREIASTLREMASVHTDLDIVVSLLRDHYGVNVLILPPTVDRLAVVSLAKAVHDYQIPKATDQSFSDGRKQLFAARQLARFVLDLFGSQPEPPEAT